MPPFMGMWLSATGWGLSAAGGGGCQCCRWEVSAAGGGLSAIDGGSFLQVGDQCCRWGGGQCCRWRAYATILPLAAKEVAVSETFPVDPKVGVHYLKENRPSRSPSHSKYLAAHHLPPWAKERVS